MLGAVGLMPLTSQAQPPANVLFLLDNQYSMQDFPTYLPEAFTPGYSPTTGTAGNPGYNDPKYGHFLNTGCSDPALVQAMSWFDKHSMDPAKNGSVVYDNDPSFASSFFDPNSFYHSRGRRVSWNGNNEDYPYSMSVDFKSAVGNTDASTACRATWNHSGDYVKNRTLLNECVACLTTKGWWRGPITPPGTATGALGPPQPKDQPELPPEARRKWIVSGRVLNLRPPGFVSARKALKDVIQTASHVRIGVASFGGDRGWFDPAWILSDVRPHCEASFPSINEAELNRTALSNAVNNTLFRHNERSLGETLFSLGGYFSSQNVDGRWGSWFDQSVIGNTNWGWPGQPGGGTYDNPYWPYQSGGAYARSSDEWLKGPYTDPVTGLILPGQRWEAGGTQRSICSADQVNAIVVVTKGAPQYDNSVPITKMMELLIAQGAQHPDDTPLTFDPVNPRYNPNSGGVNYCDWFEKSPGVLATKADCDYTDYNWPTGLAAGNKNFMDDVAFFLSHADLRGDLPGTQRVRTYVVGYGSSHPMLQSVALAGQGIFFRADDPAALRQALEQALTEISFATP
ncbi:hypothetical protein BON30_35335 [Cystobacter ferrugineus]|uniref:Uncharacterized protein n=2 Tax=Cystobacter ferrugineus TaxID=83449 RepID=A0A1L9B0V7_9BACT|nr:hypothetical protein BON30_35335 [Cystobacter ferrugineus]